MNQCSDACRSIFYYKDGCYIYLRPSKNARSWHHFRYLFSQIWDRHLGTGLSSNSRLSPEAQRKGTVSMQFERQYCKARTTIRFRQVVNIRVGYQSKERFWSEILKTPYQHLRAQVSQSLAKHQILNRREKAVSNAMWSSWIATHQEKRDAFTLMPFISHSSPHEGATLRLRPSPKS